MSTEQYAVVARASSARGEVVLRRRFDADAPEDSPSVLELRVNGVFVMDDRETHSEVLLAREALASAPRVESVLVGGLGLGFTAHEVLADPRVRRLVVAELEPALVGWFRDGTIPHGREFLADGRVHVAEADVRQVLEEATPASYDVVLLDVDNGPGFLVHEENAALYDAPFLEVVRDRLRPGGELVVWSCDPAPGLADALTATFGGCTRVPIRVDLQGREQEYFLLRGCRQP